ncbi:MAG: hypothetical protein JNG88_05520 [Phycisphaerales bacterium]|nr:hypothetical protein [Phycisphaerales bacterium]
MLTSVRRFPLALHAAVMLMAGTLAATTVMAQSHDAKPAAGMKHVTTAGGMHSRWHAFAVLRVSMLLDALPYTRMVYVDSQPDILVERGLLRWDRRYAAETGREFDCRSARTLAVLELGMRDAPTR